MTRDELPEVRTASPFGPLRIRLDGGRALDGAQAAFAALHSTGRTVVVFRPEEDPFDIAGATLITGVEVGNGQGRRRPRH